MLYDHVVQQVPCFVLAALTTRPSDQRFALRLLDNHLGGLRCVQAGGDRVEGLRSVQAAEQVYGQDGEQHDEGQRYNGADGALRQSQRLRFVRHVDQAEAHCDQRQRTQQRNNASDRQHRQAQFVRDRGVMHNAKQCEGDGDEHEQGERY